MPEHRSTPQVLRAGDHGATWPTRPAVLRPGKISRRDGAVLYLPRRAVTHMAAHPDVTFHLLRAAFERANLPANKKRLKEEVDFGRSIGLTSKVPTAPVAPCDTVAFAYRLGRRYPSRVVLGVPKPVTSLLVLVAEREHDGGDNAWTLETAYLGSDAPLEPLSREVIKGQVDHQAAVLDFWCNHAFVYDRRECATSPFDSSWVELCDRRRSLGPDGFPEHGPYWTGGS